MNRPLNPLPKKNAVSNELLATLIFVMTEVMFFMALISAYVVIRSSSGAWNPPANVQLPVMATALNTVALLSSGVLLHLSRRAFLAQDIPKCTTQYKRALFLGAFFVCFQGVEWVQLLQVGMTIESGLFAACFFLLVGCHASHAILGIGILVYGLKNLKQFSMTSSAFSAMQLFWSFIVGIWPVLYFVIYLS
jgi:cytochrome c oxidase subunit III